MITKRRCAAVLGAAMFLSACGTDGGFRYENNATERTFFKVPKDWAKYTIKREISKERPTPIPSSSNTWRVVFTAAKTPSAADFDQAAPVFPVVMSEILQFNADFRGDTSFHDGISISGMRSFATDFALDPVSAVKNGDPTVELVKYTEINTKQGKRGNRVVFNWRVNDTTWVTIDQTSYLDVNTSKFYRLVVKCESTCFKQARSELNQIAESYQVRA